MTVTNPNEVDLAYEEDGNAVLCISDHLSWEADEMADHWETLQKKINAYMGYIDSGQYRDLFEKPREVQAQRYTSRFLGRSWSW